MNTYDKLPLKRLPFKIQNHPTGYDGYNQLAVITTEAKTIGASALLKVNPNSKALVERRTRTAIVDNVILNVRGTQAGHFRPSVSQKSATIRCLNTERLSKETVDYICTNWDTKIPLCVFLVQHNITVDSTAWEFLPAAKIVTFVGKMNYYDVHPPFGKRYIKRKTIIKRTLTKDERLHAQALYRRATIILKTKGRRIQT